MAKRSAPRRGRGRKRRGGGAAATARPPAAPAAGRDGDSAPGAGPGASGGAGAGESARGSAAGARRESRRSARERREAARATTRFGDALTLGERPQPPWHPLPLSEILIFVGMIGILVGFARGKHGLAVILAGVASVLVGTLDFTIREHLSGYRSHATLLAAVPTAIFHSVLTVILLAAGAPSPTWAVAPLLLDVPVFIFSFRLLRERFREARHQRVLAAGR